MDCKLFADDLKIFGGVSHHQEMQQALHILDKWKNDWQLGISVHKCVSLHLGKNNPELEYHLSEHSLPSEKCVRDLGVFVSCDLKSSEHCQKVALKAYRVANMILRNFETKDVNVLLFAYKVYIRPLVEYCTPVWNPYLLKDIDKIENIQRYFTRQLFRRAGLPKTASYLERLKFFGLQSLEERRLHFDLCMVYNIMHGENDLNPSDFFIRVPQSKTRGHHMKLYQKSINTDIKLHSFSQRVIPIWNSLPIFINQNQPIVNAMNIKIFKHRIMQIDFWQFLKFDRDY